MVLRRTKICVATCVCSNKANELQQGVSLLFKKSQFLHRSIVSYIQDQYPASTEE